MKALISPNETFTYVWVTSWKQENNQWVPNTTESIENCQRIAQVEPDSNIFEVAQPLYWIDCPDNCVSDDWYYKNGECKIKLRDVEKPQED